MHTDKCKIWDSRENKWFKPTYPHNKSSDTVEIFFSQAGELFLRTVTTSEHVTTSLLTFVQDDRYIACLYSGVKDNNDKKAYVNDTIKFELGAGVIVFNAGCYMIQYTDETGSHLEPLGFDSEGRRRAFEVTGNVLQNSQL